MTQKLILELFFYLCVCGLLASWQVRSAMLKRRGGACLFPLKRRKNGILCGIAVFSAICMLVVLRFRNFDFFVSTVLRLTALLALELVSRDSVYKALAGIYENMLIADGKKILKTDILSLPEIGNTSEKGKTLKILTAKAGVIFVEFENSEERNKVAQIIKERLADKESNC